MLQQTLRTNGARILTIQSRFLDRIADDFAKKFKAEKAHYDAIQAIEQENPRDGRRFSFVAVSKGQEASLRRSAKRRHGSMAFHHGMQGIGQAGDGAPALPDRSNRG